MQEVMLSCTEGPLPYQPLQLATNLRVVVMEKLPKCDHQT